MEHGTVVRLWGGRYGSGPAPTLAELNNSLPVDRRLWREDIEASRAWVQGLLRADVLTRDEAQTLDHGLLAVQSRLAESFPQDLPDEDIHSLVVRMLFAEVGDVAGKLHTGRSRNDQVVTDTRLWTMRAGAQVVEEIKAVQAALLELAKANVDVLMPAYTHLRRAQPVRVTHWLLAHFWPLERDRQRLVQALERVAVLPLGSGAIAGSGFNVDRTLLKELLGFKSITCNSIDAVGDRDWVVEIVFTAALTGSHLSRIAEDLIIFSGDEFGFITLPEAYTTGSSLMPQKRNPDGLELARGKAARLLGDVAGALAMLKGLPSGYNKDVQEDKALLFSAIDTMMLVLPATRETIAALRFNSERLAAVVEREDLLATDLADELVRRGVPFREAHSAVGKLLRIGDQAGTSVGELADAIWQSVHPAFVKGPVPRPTAEASVEARQVAGATGKSAVLHQIAEAEAALK
ncbi:MAG: argininosuccinate lyase [Gemmatimonadota bacterium]